MSSSVASSRVTSPKSSPMLEGKDAPREGEVSPCSAPSLCCSEENSALTSRHRQSLTKSPTFDNQAVVRLQAHRSQDSLRSSEDSLSAELSSLQEGRPSSTGSVGSSSLADGMELSSEPSYRAPEVVMEKDEYQSNRALAKCSSFVDLWEQADAGRPASRPTLIGGERVEDEGDAILEGAAELQGAP